MHDTDTEAENRLPATISQSLHVVSFVEIDYFKSDVDVALLWYTICILILITMMGLRRSSSLCTRNAKKSKHGPTNLLMAINILPLSC